MTVKDPSIDQSRAVIQLNPITFPLSGTRLIEASAGTGKTYTIAALYLRLVLGHGGEASHPKGGLMPPEILVVTFTNAATEELRDRIRARLVEGARYFRGENSSGDPFLESLKKSYSDDQHGSCALKLELAAQMMDLSAIHTIHSWCQRMLREHAFDSGSLFNLQLETDLSEVRQEAVRDYWRSQFYPLSSAMLRPIVALYANPEALSGAIRPLIGRRLDAIEPAELLRRQQILVEEVKSTWRMEWERVQELILSAIANKVVSKAKIKPVLLEEVQRWLDNEHQPLPVNGAGKPSNACKYFTHDGIVAACNKGKSVDDNPAFAAMTRLVDGLNKLDLKKNLLSHAANWVSERMESEKRKLAILGFDDLMRHLDSALESGAEPSYDDKENSQAALTDQSHSGEVLAERIRAQFPVALIDEFQDTDPVQYRLFQRLYLNQPQASLLMIGDPKQAIYAFRGADIHTYLQARRDTAGRHYTLTKNYRSTTEMVAAANSVFELAAGNDQGPFLFGDEIPFVSVDANGRKQAFVCDGNTVPALNLWFDDTDEVINKGNYLARQAEAAASEISRLLNLSDNGKAGFETQTGEDAGSLTPLKAADIAILVRDFNEANAIRTAMTERGIRSVYLSDKDSVYASGEAEDLRLILTAVAMPGDERAIRAALATHTLGVSWANLDGLNQDEQRWDACVEAFREYLNLWQRQGVMPMLRQLLSDYQVPRRLMAQGQERSLTNLLHLAELLQGASATLEGELALLRLLTEMIETGSGDDDQILRLESDAELVQVVTIHKSKGLEYPLVFLPFILGFRQASAWDGLISYRDAEGNSAVAFNPSQEVLDQAEFERLAEDLRLLYVAITRPVFACYLGLAAVKLAKTGKRGEPDLHLSGLGHLLSGGTALGVSEVRPALQALVSESALQTELSTLPEATDESWSEPELNHQMLRARACAHRVPQGWRVGSYSALLHGMSHHHDDGDTSGDASQSRIAELMQEHAAEVEIEPDANTIHGFPKGAVPGTFLHDLLEWVAEQPGGFGSVCGETADGLLEEVTLRCQQRGFEGWESVLCDWTLKALTQPMKLPAGHKTVSLHELSTVVAEMEFWFASNKMQAAELDRLVTQGIWPNMPRPKLNPQQLNGMIKGFIDLTFEYEGQYFVADYKSNYLGPDASSYTLAAMQEAMLSHRYELQLALYTLALHRLLKSRIDNYCYQQHVGGGVYLFLRGMGESFHEENEDGVMSHEGNGVIALLPDEALILAMDKLFLGEGA